MPAQSMNCEPLSEDLQVSWAVDTDTITIELAGRIGKFIVNSYSLDKDKESLKN